MKLFADSGSTKTLWSLRTANGQHSEFRTDGINPFFQTYEQIHATISNQLLPQVAKYFWAGKLTHIYFYGAGCAFAEKNEIVKQALQSCFKHAEINIASDLVGAARGLFGNTEGIACILGTGSNSCHYNGSEIVHNVSPLGYVLGDEGSGAVLGKTLVADILKKQVPAHLCEKFFEQYQLTPAQVLDSVYKQAFPNRFLASFAPFISEHIHEPAMYNMVYAAFDAFVKRNVLQYARPELPISFVGSVAFHFSDILQRVIADNGLTLGQIVQSPLGLMVNG